jgi:hypothetical protein
MSAARKLLHRIHSYPLGLTAVQKCALFIILFCSSLTLLAVVNEIALYHFSGEDFERFFFGGSIYLVFFPWSPFVWIWGALILMWVFRRKPEDEG